MISTGGNLDFHRWKSRFRGLVEAFYYEVDGVKVGLTLPSASDVYKACSFKLFDEPVNARDAHAHILRESFLAWKAALVVPGIA